MTLDEASIITHNWGLYLEHCGGKHLVLFMGNIPESLLPYPIQKIEEALNLVAKLHHDNGNYEQSKTLKNSIGHLLSYTTDKEAIQILATNLSSESRKESIVSGLKQVHKDWIETH